MATEPWPRPPQRLHQQADLLYFETEGKGKTWTEIEFSIKSRKVEEKPRKKQNNFALLGTIRVHTHVVKSFEENQGKYKQTMLAIHVVRMVQRVNLCK